MSKGQWAFRPAALTRAIKAAEKAGKDVVGAEIDSVTGQIRVKIPNIWCAGHSGRGQRVGSNLMRRPPKFLNVPGK